MRKNNKVEEQLENEKEYNEAYLQLYNFFECLYDYNQQSTEDKNSDINPINNIDFTNLTYREGQNSYALDIMETIKNKDILLIQAGVGIGKSFGYLLPVFYTYNHVEKFNKVIISTSSIALQEQLLQDIKIISDMLKINIKADIAKGINNYACLKRIYYRIEDYRVDMDTKIILDQIATQIKKIESSDRNDLTQISEQIWNQIQLQSRGYCSHCSYSKLCPFYQKQKTINQNNIIITNHANMVRNVLDQTSLIRNLDMIIFDEAHKLEENMQNIRVGEIKLQNMIQQIEKTNTLLGHQYQKNNIISIGDEENESAINDNLKTDIESLFSSIRSSASRNFFEKKKTITSEEDYSITDTTHLAFRITPTVSKNLQKVLQGLENLFKEIMAYEENNHTQLEVREIKYLTNTYLLLRDMLKKENSDNIYWADFYRNNKISIFYTPKDNLDITKSIFQSKIPIVCTSGTILDNQDGYDYFSQGISLNKSIKRTISYGEEQKSPYDYANNSLFYYNPNISSPKDYHNYIKDLAVEISELIKMTNGKALILFTSKKTMNSVYNLLDNNDFPFEILLHTDTNTNEIKEHFAKEVNSCLFATGAFWEGIDIKGKSLSNLIITRLPFDQVDAITQYKASKYAKNEQFKQVYFPNMLIKIEQAIGRLIRSDEDTGIVCCLDSRFANYKTAIDPNIPMQNYTTDKKILYQFVEDKILNQTNIDLYKTLSKK